MITFPETLDALERLLEHLRAVEQLAATLEAAVGDLDGCASLLDYAHEKQFQNAEEALQYIDNVLKPQIRGMRDSLAAGMTDPMRRLQTALEQADRLVVRLRMVVEGDADDFLPWS